LAEKVDRHEGSPAATLALGGEQLKLLNFDVSSVPDVAQAVFRARDEVVGLAFVWRLSVHLDGAWDELDVGDVVFVRFVDI